MSRLSKLVAEALQEELADLDVFLHGHILEERLARAAIGAMRNFDTSDFTFSEAEAIRRMLDESLSDVPQRG